MTSMDLSFRRTNLLRNQPIARGDADPLPLLLVAAQKISSKNQLKKYV